MTTRTLRAALGTCVALVVFVSPLPTAFGQEEAVEPVQSSATLQQYGWWNKAQQGPNASTAVPAPPGAPEDGIYLAYEPATSSVPGVVTGAPSLIGAAPGALPVASPAPAPPAPAAPAVTGPEAYGAVRYLVPEGAEGELLLRFVPSTNSQPGGVNLDAGAIKACPALSPWDPVQNGRYDGAPGFDCSSFADGQVLGDVLAFTLPATLANEPGVFDLVIVPAPGSTQPFQTSILAPTDGSLVLTSVPETFSDEAFDSGSFGDPLDEFAPDDFALEDFTIEDTAASDFFADGSFTAGTPARPAVRRPQVAVPAGNPLNPFRPDASRGERLLAVAILLLIALGLFWLGSQPVRAPRLLGSLGAGAAEPVPAGRERGIGRFSRMRGDTKAPRLF